MTNEGNSSQGIGIGDWLDPLLDPARVIGYLDFEIAGRGRRAGRATIEARATPRSSSGGRDPFRFALHALGTGAEEYLLSVDAQTGVLLRSELRHDGEPFSVIEALEIGFDEPLGDELFVFHAPQDVDVVPMSTRLRHRHNVPLHEAVALADFPVYVLPKVPDEWDLSVSFNARPHRTVVLWYRSRDAAATLNVAQTAVDDAEPAMRPRGAECIERDGRELYVRDRAEDWPQAQLSTTVGKTSISMNSNALGAEDLIRLTETLVPASTDPPSLA